VASLSEEEERKDRGIAWKQRLSERIRMGGLGGVPQQSGICGRLRRGISGEYAGQEIASVQGRYPQGRPIFGREPERTLERSTDYKGGYCELEPKAALTRGGGDGEAYKHH